MCAVEVDNLNPENTFLKRSESCTVSSSTAKPSHLRSCNCRRNLRNCLILQSQYRWRKEHLGLCLYKLINFVNNTLGLGPHTFCTFITFHDSMESGTSHLVCFPHWNWSSGAGWVDGNIFQEGKWPNLAETTWPF